MKKYFIGLISLCFISCVTDNSNRVYFNINPKDRKIVLNIRLNDSIPINMAFDTGARLGVFILDSTFTSLHPSLISDNLPADVIMSGSAWASKLTPTARYKNALNVKIGKTNKIYEEVWIMNRRKYFNTSDSDGLFNIPKEDTIHVWELNFENNYLEIHQSENFKMPKNCLLAPILNNENYPYPFNIQLPFKIRCANGDTLILDRTFMIDTGLSNDVAIMCRAEELSFFNKQKDAVWLSFMNSYIRYYTVDATLFDNVNLDSLRIYTYDYQNYVKSDYLIGQNFLKRFNVFFDLKNRQIGLQPIKHFQRVSNPNYLRFYYLKTQTKTGKIVVTFVADYKDNCYKKAGFQKGDEIVALNAKQYNSLTPDDVVALRKLNTLTYDIIRDGKPLKITVKIDKNMQTGD